MCSLALREAGELLSELSGGLHDGLLVLRHGPGWVHEEPHRGRDPCSISDAAAIEPQKDRARRIYGNGRATAQFRRATQGNDASPRQSRSELSPHYRLDRRDRAEDR